MEQSKKDDKIAIFIMIKEGRKKETMTNEEGVMKEKVSLRT